MPCSPCINLSSRLTSLFIRRERIKYFTRLQSILQGPSVDISNIYLTLLSHSLLAERRALQKAHYPPRRGDAVGCSRSPNGNRDGGSRPLPPSVPSLLSPSFSASPSPALGARAAPGLCLVLSVRSRSSPRRAPGKTEKPPAQDQASLGNEASSVSCPLLLPLLQALQQFPPSSPPSWLRGSHPQPEPRGLGGLHPTQETREKCRGTLLPQHQDFQAPLTHVSHLQ